MTLQDEHDGDFFGTPTSGALARVPKEALNRPLNCLFPPRDVGVGSLEEGPERFADDPVTRFADPRFPVREGDEGEDDVAPGLTAGFSARGVDRGADEDPGPDKGVQADEAGKEQVAFLAGVHAGAARRRFHQLGQEVCGLVAVRQEGRELSESDGEPLPRGVVGRSETRDESLQGVRQVGSVSTRRFWREGQRCEEVCRCVDPSVRVVRSEQREQGQDRLPRSASDCRRHSTVGVNLRQVSGCVRCLRATGCSFRRSAQIVVEGRHSQNRAQARRRLKLGERY